MRILLVPRFSRARHGADDQLSIARDEFLVFAPTGTRSRRRNTRPRCRFARAHRRADLLYGDIPRVLLAFPGVIVVYISLTVVVVVSSLARDIFSRCRHVIVIFLLLRTRPEIVRTVQLCADVHANILRPAAGKSVKKTAPIKIENKKE